MTALAWLLDPGTVADFLETTWGKQFLYQPGADPDKFTGLLSVQELLVKSFSGTLQFPDLRIKQHGALVRRPELLQGSMYNPEELKRELQWGSTFNVTNIHRWHPPIHNLLKSLRTDVRCNVLSSAFYTPAKTIGRVHSVHFDPVDTFVLQVAGQKLWRLYDSPALGTVNISYREKATPYLVEQLLQPGDMLYVPRGMVHSADTADFSLHVNVGFEAVRAADVLMETLQHLAESDIAYRQPLLPDFRETPDVWADQVDTLLREAGRSWQTMLPTLPFEGRYGKDNM